MTDLINLHIANLEFPNRVIYFQTWGSFEDRI